MVNGTEKRVGGHFHLETAVDSRYTAQSIDLRLDQENRCHRRKNEFFRLFS
ncbi:MAG: hypothetical protein HQL67_02730 [Magnetococcales bacterium]|nr:hypothetical protein [Magnetococcales bacterium]